MNMRRVLLKTGGFLLALSAAVLLCLGFFRFRMDPILSDLARASASAGASRTITQAVSRRISREDAGYEKIICFEKDYEGHVTALKTNMQLVNSLKADVLNTINEEIMKLSRSEIGIPLGNLLFPELFSGRGPKIPVRILSIRKSNADFLSHFTQAGINQTLHRLTLRVQVEGSALVLGRILTFSSSGTVLVAETVIVGQVPNTFS